MKSLLSVCLILLAIGQSGYAQEPAPGVRAATNVRESQYPRILPDNRVLFQITAPGASSVQISLGAIVDLKKQANGVWTGTTAPLTGGLHYYNLLIDSVAVADPASEAFYSNRRMTSGIEIPYPERDYYALKKVPHGDIRSNPYYSEATGEWRRMLVYTPPGYDLDPARSYPVLYLLHGGGEDERGWANQGKADRIMDNLLAAGQTEPMLVVMLDGNADIPAIEERYLEFFETELINTAIPFVENTYRVKPGASNRALAGLSLGGMQTLFAGVRHSELFAYLGVFSSGWILPDQQGIADHQYSFMRDRTAEINANLKLFWISMGGQEDIAYANCRIMLSRYDALGIHYEYSESPGGHSWPVWRHDLYRFAPQLFR